MSLISGWGWSTKCGVVVKIFKMFVGKECLSFFMVFPSNILFFRNNWGAGETTAQTAGGQSAERAAANSRDVQCGKWKTENVRKNREYEIRVWSWT